MFIYQEFIGRWYAKWQFWPEFQAFSTAVAQISAGNPSAGSLPWASRANRSQPN
jgi:hypothetical protein